MGLNENPDACVILVTCSTIDEAERIAETIVREKLAACVNIIGENTPVRSFYLWEGQLQKEPEILLVIKTRLSLAEALYGRITALHGYGVPEFIALPIAQGSPAYLGWLMDNTAQTSSSGMS